MSYPSLRFGVGAVRLLDGVRSGKTTTQSYTILKRFSSRSISDIAARLSHASDEHRLSLGLRLSRPIYALPAQSICLDARDCRKRPLERRWRSNKVTESDDNSLEGGSRESRTCWKCMSTIRIRDFLCKCGAAQLLDGRLDYFEMFDKTPAILMDVSDVENRFKKMQRIFHPDLFVTKSAEEQAISAANSATINKAYQTLVRPMSRVKYLARSASVRVMSYCQEEAVSVYTDVLIIPYLEQINLLGSTILEEGSEDKAPAPPSLLMEVMEIRESLEHCSSMEEAEAIMTETGAAIDLCLREMDRALKAGGGKDDLEDAAVRLQYLYRIEEEARSVMHRIEDAGAKPGIG